MYETYEESLSDDDDSQPENRTFRERHAGSADGHLHSLLPDLKALAPSNGRYARRFCLHELRTQRRRRRDQKDEAYQEQKQEIMLMVRHFCQQDACTKNNDS